MVQHVAEKAVALVRWPVRKAEGTKAERALGPCLTDAGTLRWTSCHGSGWPGLGSLGASMEAQCLCEGQQGGCCREGVSRRRPPWEGNAALGRHQAGGPGWQVCPKGVE